MLRPPVERWTRPESEANIASAPRFSQPAPPREQLNALVAGYARITGDLVRGPAKRNLIAACYRVHGEDFLSLVAELFRATGTATNLLGEIRCMSPRVRSAAVTAISTPSTFTTSGTQTGEPRRVGGLPQRADKVLDCGCPVDGLLPGLIYCADHRLAFDGRDRRRHDRRPSNPEAARFFAADPPRGNQGTLGARAAAARQ